MDAVANLMEKQKNQQSKEANQVNRIKTYFSREVLLCLNRITRIYTQFIYIPKTFAGIIVNALQLRRDIVM